MPKEFTSSEAKKLLPKRLRKDNKTKGGKALIIAGSSGMEGAAILSATSAARSGAGYVYLWSDSKKLLATKNPDFLCLFSFNKFSAQSFSAIGVGPGLKNRAALKKWIFRLKKNHCKNVVLDAEAINFLSELKRDQKLPPSWILTPHEGELAKLLNVSSVTIRKQRTKYILLAQKKYGCIILLKGHQTLIANAKCMKKILVGNAALSKAGTGDVLTGIIVGFLSQGTSPFEAACLGAYVHGFMSDQWLKDGNDILSLMASDLIQLLPKTLSNLREQI